LSDQFVCVFLPNNKGGLKDYRIYLLC